MPGKQEVRQWLARRCAERGPLPGREQIQRELGWMPREAGTACAHGSTAERTSLPADSTAPPTP